MIVPVFCQSQLFLVHLCGVGHFALTLVGVEFAVQEGLDVFALVVIDELFEVHEGDAHFHDFGEDVILLLSVFEQFLFQ